MTTLSNESAAPASGPTLLLQRGPESRDELWHLVRYLWGITIPRHKVCADHDAPFDAFACAYFNEEPQILIRGSRGLAGKTRMMSILGLTIAVVKGSDVNILGGSMNQSTNVHETIRTAFDSPNAPRYMLIGGVAHQSLIRLTNGAKIRPLTASQKTVRGPHPATLLCDEIDEMDADILEAAKGQPMPQKNWLGEEIQAQTIMGSTWQNPDGTMKAEMDRFDREGLPVFNWCWRESAAEPDGWLSETFVAQKKREISDAMWEVEYELGEPSIGNRAFDADAVERTFSLPADPGPQGTQKVSKEFSEYHFADYGFDKEYVIAADWAKSQDWTVITVYDCTQIPNGGPAKVVHWVRMRRRPYPVMIEHFNRLMKRYNAEAIHDATGLGGVVADYLDVRARGFLMTGEKRDNMLSEFVNAVENDKIRAPRVKEFHHAVLYASVEQLYSRAKEFHLPDEVCSMALGWHLISRRHVAADPMVMDTSEKENWMSESITHNRDQLGAHSGWVGEVVKKGQNPEAELNLMI